MGDGAAKTELFEQLARVGKALGSGKRLELLDLLAQGPRSVADLAAVARLELTTASSHLQALKRAGLVTTTRHGTTIEYALAGDDVAALWLALREVAARRVADVRPAAAAYLGPEDTEEIDRAELLRRVSAGTAIVLDVRPAPEYAAAHIPGAVSIPLDELAGRLEEIPADQEVVAYCRGALCVFSHDAVRLLAARGRRAVRLVDGFLEWQLAGHPVDVHDR
ncbi:Rhodanese-like protein [Pseudonocardia dioxanivorans CB1190]|uniref:Rhodanese-like protein n=1 Tax=Pseudonocardia dioxanivorans (strain ATCC 55486 / DSM 44775 / JCM 13855 / CB1190) TaxID=675635 RepID=F4CXD8_PSEUX|nr:metalloregulator ArsR/SmtB family transcription factor [Pseudonocardia dioxanivorans]AEA26512.1 Rhodanese-like protein [Pseudonocardia dioxanivorans CB1190]